MLKPTTTPVASALELDAPGGNEGGNGGGGASGGIGGGREGVGGRKGVGGAPGGGGGALGGADGGKTTTAGAPVMAATVTPATPPLASAVSRALALANTPDASELAVDEAVASGTVITAVTTTEPGAMASATADVATDASEARTALIASRLGAV